MTTHTRPATVEDALWLAQHLRPEDRAECIAASGLVPEVALPAAVASGADCELMIAPDTQNIAGICGVTPTTLPHFGSVWLLGTPEMARHPKLLVRHAIPWLAKKHDLYPVLGNCVDARNLLHIRWLSLMGFKFTTAFLHGPQGLPFIQFERTRA